MTARILFLIAFLQGGEGRELSSNAANPIRKVVTMLQHMQAKVQEEGEKDTALYHKFMCYCKTGDAELQKSIEAAQTGNGDLENKIKAAEEQLAQTKQDLKQAQIDRFAAKEAIAETTAAREKEAAAFAKEKDELDATIAGIEKAITALQRGSAGSFLQTATAQLLKHALLSKSSDFFEEGDRQELLSFLSNKETSESVGEIIGILKQMLVEMKQRLQGSTDAENASIKSTDKLIAAKKKEIVVLTKMIEAKLTKVGNLGVSIAQMKGDLSDTAEALMADKEFLANLDKNCKTKKEEWEVVVKTRAEELVALADTIKMLNDDDALDLFKKTLPSAASSLMQVQSNGKELQRRALLVLQKLSSRGADHAMINLIALALKGKKIGFDKVIKMIDEMVATLQKEQADDDHKREYCNVQIGMTEDKKKVLETSVSDRQVAIEDAKEGIAKSTEEIDALKAGIKELDKMVLEATEQRKDENEDFTEKRASNTAAKELLDFAKKRLNQFYNPKLVEKSPAAALFVQVSTHAYSVEAPPPPPEAFGAYSKKSEDNMGVIAMIDLLIADIDKDLVESETEEKDAQIDYEVAMKRSVEKRVKDSKSLVEKESIKGDLEAAVEMHVESKEAEQKELMATVRYMQSLHLECDWLLKYFDVRKEARNSEIDALGNAKAVLRGADFSLLQTDGYAL
mmetsp:Transcript_89939/g.173109  ORF Transcript_89939/g.173109 Transcript_89939/m.173109 type:complete len:683 (+) Transcript_89939:66-2114(+)